MYGAFWCLQGDPFSLSPDPAFLYRCEQHQKALATLIEGVQGRRGFVVLTGEAGTGKTTLLNCLRGFLERHGIDFAFIFNPRVNADQLFEMIASSLELPCNWKSRMEVLRALRELLLENSRHDRTAALIIDEAQNISPDVLEDIRLLGNLEHRRRKLLQVVLAGQPEFETTLDAPAMRALKQRIALRCSLQPLSEAQTHEYISTRLERAGMANQTIFPPEVASEIHLRSQGIPRLINSICDNLLLAAFTVKSRVTTMEMIEAVSQSMRLECAARVSVNATAASPDRIRLSMATLGQFGGLAASSACPASSSRPAESDNSPAPSHVKWERPREQLGVAARTAIKFSRAALVRMILLMKWLGSLAGSGAQAIWLQLESVARGAIKFGHAGMVRLISVLKSLGHLAGAATSAILMRLETVRARAREKFGVVAPTAAKFGRPALVCSVVLVCIVLTVHFSGPMLSWLGSSIPEMNASQPRIAQRTAGIAESPPRPLRLDPAEYTPTARYARFRGKIFVIVTVDAQGKVTNVEFATPTAFDLDAGIRMAARRWRFKPAVLDGEAVEGRTLVQVPFH